MRKLLLAFSVVAACASPALANWTGKNAAGTTITFNNSGDCTSVVCVPSAEPVDSTGAAFGVTANPFFIGFGTGVTLPAFAATPTFKIDQTTPGTTNGVQVNSSALPTGAATAANQTATQPRNVAQFGGSAVVTGTGAGGAGIPRVTVSNDSFPTTQGVNIAQIAGSNVVGDPCQINTHTFTPINIAAAQNTKIVAGTTAKKTYVCHLYLFASVADNVGIVEGTGTNCGTGTTGVIGGATAAAGINLAANQGWVEGAGSNAVAATATNADDFCLITSSAAQLSGVAVTVQQ